MPPNITQEGVYIWGANQQQPPAENIQVLIRGGYNKKRLKSSNIRRAMMPKGRDRYDPRSVKAYTNPPARGYVVWDEYNTQWNKKRLESSNKRQAYIPQPKTKSYMKQLLGKIEGAPTISAIATSPADLERLAVIAENLAKSFQAQPDKDAANRWALRFRIHAIQAMKRPLTDDELTEVRQLTHQMEQEAFRLRQAVPPIPAVAPLPAAAYQPRQRVAGVIPLELFDPQEAQFEDNRGRALRLREENYIQRLLGEMPVRERGRLEDMLRGVFDPEDVVVPGASQFPYSGEREDIWVGEEDVPPALRRRPRFPQLEYKEGEPRQPRPPPSPPLLGMQAPDEPEESVEQLLDYGRKLLEKVTARVAEEAPADVVARDVVEPLMDLVAGEAKVEDVTEEEEKLSVSQQVAAVVENINKGFLVAQAERPEIWAKKAGERKSGFTADVAKELLKKYASIPRSKIDQMAKQHAINYLAQQPDLLPSRVDIAMRAGQFNGPAKKVKPFLDAFMRAHPNPREVSI